MPEEDYTITFAREFGDANHTDSHYGDVYNIGHQGEDPDLFSRFVEAFPGRILRFMCNEGICTLYGDQEWSAEDETTIADLVATHKVVEDWPPENWPPAE